jgi:hypothetical protein
MSIRMLVTRAKRVFSKPPSYVARRIWAEIDHTLAGYTQPAFGRRFQTRDLLRRVEAADVDSLWRRLVSNSRRIFPATVSHADLEALAPGETARILASAERAMRNEIDLLGSGPVSLGATVDWHRDYKTGDRWPVQYFRRIDYINIGRASDVKTVWELSRMQWLLPCAQAFVLTGEQYFARHVRGILSQWIGANPYTCGVNWGVTMEPAMRLLTWTWLLRACADSDAFADRGFREQFMRALFLHGLFVEKYFERSDVNGNHFTADAAGLLVAGVLFGSGEDAQRWQRDSTRDVEHEIALQVFADGVDFEASSAYHRLVAELFLVSAMALRAAGREPSGEFRRRLVAMAEFTAAYSRPDGLAPLWGDNDDARAVLLGSQPLRDHRYLVGLVGLHFQEPRLVEMARGSRAEAAWLFGAAAAGTLRETGPDPGSRAFREGGVYVLRDERNHVFIDCGPLGLAGRGGHGHNDLLSFEAVLDGVPLITEGGCYVYTADEVSRDIDRSTRSHNTPTVDGQEINRFIGPEFRWNMHNDARHELVEFSVDAAVDRFIGRHGGFERLAQPVTVERTIELSRGTAVSLRIRDLFKGTGIHELRVPLHFVPGAMVSPSRPGTLSIEISGRAFEVRWESPDWRVEIGQGRQAPSYGTKFPIARVEWCGRGEDLELDLVIRTASPVGAST